MKFPSHSQAPERPEEVSKGHRSAGDVPTNIRNLTVDLDIVSGNTIYASSTSPEERGPLRVVNATCSLHSQPALGDTRGNKGKQPASAGPSTSWQTCRYSFAPGESANMIPLIAQQVDLRPRPKPVLINQPAPPAKDPWHDNSSPLQRKRHPSEDYVGFRGIEPQIWRLINERLWTHRPASDFEVQKLHGGSYNRIVAIKVKTPAILNKSKIRSIRRTLMKEKAPADELEHFTKFAMTYDSGEYILRIPRLYKSKHANYDFHADDMMHDFVLGLGIDCPKIVTYDEKDNGITPWPYLLQEKIPGESLWDVYPRLTQKQKVQIATQIGTTCKKMTARSYSTYGKLKSLGKPSKDADGTANTRDKTFAEPEWVHPSKRSVYTPVHRIIQQGMFHHAREQRDLLTCPPWNDLINIIDNLEQLGAFGQSEGWYFTHGDFYPRNIMANVDSKGNAHITAVLDWDMATFQPAVMACRPPAFLWQWKFYSTEGGDEDNLDIIADNPCVSKNDQEIKLAFDEAAGEEYCRIAYHSYAWTARKMVLWVEKGWDNRMGREWPFWASWFVKNWEMFEQAIRNNGFPRDWSRRIANPPYLK